MNSKAPFRSNGVRYIGIGGGMAGLSVFYVSMSARVLSMFCGSTIVLLTRMVGKSS